MKIFGFLQVLVFLSLALRSHTVKSTTGRYDANIALSVCEDRTAEKTSDGANDSMEALLDLPRGAIANVLSFLKANHLFENLEGLIFFGSRAHKLWGFGYDLDVLLLGRGLPFDHSEVFRSSRSSIGISLDLFIMSPDQLRLLIEEKKVPSPTLWSSEMKACLEQGESFRRVFELDEPIAQAEALNQLLSSRNLFAVAHEELSSWVLPLSTYRQVLRKCMQRVGFYEYFAAGKSVFLLKNSEKGGSLATPLKDLGYPVFSIRALPD